MMRMTVRMTRTIKKMGVPVLCGYTHLFSLSKKSRKYASYLV